MSNTINQNTMKKNFILLVVLLVSSVIFSQKIIDKPDYGFSNLPGKLTKIELTDSATIIHFYVKYPAGQWIFIPKESYIQDVNGGEKYFVTKTEGIPLGERYTMTESGEVSYQLYFPKLNSAVNKVDFGEANEGGSWTIYDIVINEQETASLLPKELQGNWLQADGSNQWDFGFYTNQAIVDQAVWNYKTVEKKKNNYTIVLEREGKQKIVYAQIDRKGVVMLGKNKENLAIYSTEKRDNPNYKPAQDEVYNSAIFKSDSATYSGFVKGYSPRVGVKTIAIHIDDIITGAQNTYVATIAENGFFSIQLPLYYPHEVWVRSSIFNGSVYLEPGKEVFQLFADKQTLYMGASARLNADLEKTQTIRRTDYEDKMNTILDMKPEAYKVYCQKITNNKQEKLASLRKSNSIGAKAYQIGKLEIEYNGIIQMLDYPRDLETAYRKKNNIPREQRDIDLKMDTLTADYYDFITDATFNNQLAVISTHSYQGAINRLQYLDVVSIKSVRTTIFDIADELNKRGYSMTQEEQQLLLDMKQIEILQNTPEYKEFNNKYAQVSTAFVMKHQKIIKEITKDAPFSIEKLETYLLNNKIPISEEEKEFLIAEKKLSKSATAVKLKNYNSIGPKIDSFYKKHNTITNFLYSEKRTNFRNEKLAELFGVKPGLATDIMDSQSICSTVVDQVTPLSEEELIRVQQSIQTPFIADYLRKCNEQTLAKLENNKSKTGFVLNDTPKTDADKLFEGIMKKYKGKVVYVDFWATWCGPCRSGIEQIKPLKEEMKDKEVVFVYLTNQSSPENTYSAMIPDIKGEHYRLSTDEWNYLSGKFNISGIPHYVLVNKNGEIVNPKLGHHSNEALKGILEKQL